MFFNQSFLAFSRLAVIAQWCHPSEMRYPKHVFLQLDLEDRWKHHANVNEDNFFSESVPSQEMTPAKGSHNSGQGPTPDDPPTRS